MCLCTGGSSGGRTGGCAGRRCRSAVCIHGSRALGRGLAGCALVRTASHVWGYHRGGIRITVREILEDLIRSLAVSRVQVGKTKVIQRVIVSVALSGLIRINGHLELFCRFLIVACHICGGALCIILVEQCIPDHGSQVIIQLFSFRVEVLSLQFAQRLYRLGLVALHIKIRHLQKLRIGVDTVIGSLCFLFGSFYIRIRGIDFILHVLNGRRNGGKGRVRVRHLLVCLVICPLPDRRDGQEPDDRGPQQDAQHDIDKGCHGGAVAECGRGDDYIVPAHIPEGDLPGLFRRHILRKGRTALYFGPLAAPEQRGLPCHLLHLREEAERRCVGIVNARCLSEQSSCPLPLIRMHVSEGKQLMGAHEFRILADDLPKLDQSHILIPLFQVGQALVILADRRVVLVKPHLGALKCLDIAGCQVVCTLQVIADDPLHKGIDHLTGLKIA